MFLTHQSDNTFRFSDKDQMIKAGWKGCFSLFKESFVIKKVYCLAKRRTYIIRRDAVYTNHWNLKCSDLIKMCENTTSFCNKYMLRRYQYR